MKLSLLQWNVLYEEKADNIVELIREVDADIVCLQELTRNTHLNPDRDIPAEIAQLGYKYSFYEPVGTLDDEPGSFGEIGNGIFSRLPIVDSRVVYVQRQKPDSTDYAEQNRAYVEVTLTTDAAPLVIGTVHLSYTDRFRITEQKRHEADALLEAVRAHQARFVLTGDLNATPGSYTIQELEKLFVSAGPDYAQKTWTTKPFAYQDFTADTLDWRLDYVFATPDINILTTKIISTEYSDHLPILATFEV